MLSSPLPLTSLLLASVSLAVSAVPLAAQCGHFEAIATPPQVQSFGKQVCTSALDLGELGRLLYQKNCPLRVVVVSARNRASRTTNETDIVVDRMVPVLTFQPACVRATYMLAWIERCISGPAVTASVMPSFKTVPCR